jgi:hypothetical protein
MCFGSGGFERESQSVEKDGISWIDDGVKCFQDLMSSMAF